MTQSAHEIITQFLTDDKTENIAYKATLLLNRLNGSGFNVINRDSSPRARFENPLPVSSFRSDAARARYFAGLVDTP